MEGLGIVERKGEGKRDVLILTDEGNLTVFREPKRLELDEVKKKKKEETAVEEIVTDMLPQKVTLAVDYFESCLFIMEHSNILDNVRVGGDIVALMNSLSSYKLSASKDKFANPANSKQLLEFLSKFNNFDYLKGGDKAKVTVSLKLLNSQHVFAGIRMRLNRASSSHKVFLHVK